MCPQRTGNGCYLFLLLMAFVSSTLAQNLPLELKVAVSHQNPLDTRYGSDYNGFGMPYLGLPDSVNGGFGVYGMFRYRLDNQFNVHLKVGYDYTYLFQDNVLDEWDWAYWEDTYIEFIPGLTVEQVNKTLKYNADNDTTQFSAVFVPTQRLRELKIAIGGGYRLALSNELALNIELEFGASIFSRELQMEEKWIKRFKLDTSNTDKYDYEYRFDLLHFAPAKKGTRFYLVPSAGLRYNLNDDLALEFDLIYSQYLSRDQIGWLEDLLAVSKDSEKWFPMTSKFQLQLGLVFNY